MNLLQPGEPSVHDVADVPDLRAARAAGVLCVAVNGRQPALRGLAWALRFPPHFGGTWDAFSDMLGDLSWLPAAGWVVVVREAQALGVDRETLIDCWRDAAALHAAERRPLHLVLISGAAPQPPR